MTEPEHILRQQGKIVRPGGCNCHDGFWMRNLVDPQCHYHSDYGEELRCFITRAADALEGKCQNENVWLNHEDVVREFKSFIAELREAAKK